MVSMQVRSVAASEKAEILRRSSSMKIMIYSGRVKKISGRLEKKPSINPSEAVLAEPALERKFWANGREINNSVPGPLRK